MQSIQVLLVGGGFDPIYDGPVERVPQIGEELFVFEDWPHKEEENHSFYKIVMVSTALGVSYSENGKFVKHDKTTVYVKPLTDPVD